MDILEKEVLNIENVQSIFDCMNLKKVSEEDSILNATTKVLMKYSEAEEDTPWEKEAKMFRINGYV